MENRKITLYVLAGAWNNAYIDGTCVVAVSEDIKELKKKLVHIVETKANEYLGHTYGDVKEEVAERFYEITDEEGGYAKFYITEHYVELSEPLMGAISREMEKINLTNDINEYLIGLYESGNIEPWKYEYINERQEVIEEILTWFEKYDDCNVSFNSILINATDRVLNELVLDDEKLEFLWEKFSDVLIDDDECILDDFIGFECGTHREAVWQWFDKHHTKGVAALMFGGE